MKRLTVAAMVAQVLAVLVRTVLVRAFEPPFEAGFPYNFYYGSCRHHRIA
jgi:hypothetical protein